MPGKLVKSIGRTLDARPDRLDLRDREYTPAVVSLPKRWPDDATIKKLLPGYCKAGLVLDQESEGACTGFGLACVVNYLHWRFNLEHGIRDTQHSVSPRMLYHLARFYDEWQGEDYSGSSCRGALKAWHKHGVCAEPLWPYRDEQKRVRFIQPRDGWAEDALHRRLGVYYRVDHRSVVDMQAAIADVGAIYVSSDVHDGWGLASKNRISGHDSLAVIKPIKKHDSVGGHAFALVGFNTIGFVVQNSWSMKWGTCGFAVLPYEEWVKYGTDAWIAALGVPSGASKPSSVPVRSKEKTVIARAGAIAFTSSNARQPPPKVKKEVERWGAERAYRHTIVSGNDGLVINRIVTHENALACVHDIACAAPATTLKPGQKPKRIVIYAHGGLNSEDGAIDRVRTLAPYFLANGVYPVFLSWKTGPTETLSAILEDELEKVPSPEGGFADVIERVKETAAEVLDRTIEVLARPAAKPIWSQMKQNAAAAADPGRGSVLLADALVELKKEIPQLEIHLVGHSAGSIILGHLLDLLPERELTVASCHLYAPACTVRFALDHYVAAMEKGVLGRKQFQLHVLADAVEICDTVGPYRKSLLYLVSRALETCHKMPILGLEQVFDPRSNPKWHETELANLKEWQKYWATMGNALNIVSDKQVSTGTLGRMIPAAHGSFDNDATTIATTLKRITGGAPAFPIEWIEY
jgi:hypothetical protein